jgi:hypothetical protein
MLKIIIQKEPSQISVVTVSKLTKGDNFDNIILEIFRHFRNKKTEYMKDKIDETATNNKNKNNRDLYIRINEFKGVSNL